MASEVLTPPATTFARLQPPRRFLFGPGPTQVDPRVYEALSKPIVGHLDPFFFTVLDDIQKLLKLAFVTESARTFAISATGSGGMETAVSNFLEQGSKFAVFANGYFADRISEMGKRYGTQVVRFEKPWGEAFTDQEATDFINREKPAVVAYVQAETSTGVFQNGKAICDAAHKVGALVIADVVTSLGAMPVKFDETGIDVAYSCSQKGLSCPPGLSPMALSVRAIEKLDAKTTPNRSWYFDLKLLNEFYASAHRYHHTAPISSFYALREALVLASEEGFQERWDRHQRAHKLFVKGVESLGLKMHVKQGHRIVNLNTVDVPAGVDDTKVRRRLLEEHGIEIMGGFGQLAGKVFRIGVMGPLATEENVNFFLKAFAGALKAEGYKQ